MTERVKEKFKRWLGNHHWSNIPDNDFAKSARDWAKVRSDYVEGGKGKKFSFAFKRGTKPHPSTFDKSDTKEVVSMQVHDENGTKIATDHVHRDHTVRVGDHRAPQDIKDYDFSKDKGAGENSSQSGSSTGGQPESSKKK